MPDPLVRALPLLRPALAPVDPGAGAGHEEPPVTVPVARTGGASRWPGAGAVAWVPVELLLASKGRCSCPPCVQSYVGERARGVLHLVR